MRRTVVSPINVHAQVGKRAVEKLVDAVIDTFSPASESLGLLGDVVRLARVEVATEITKRAKTIAESAGLRLVAPPLKFLVPFFEKASTEEISENELMNMWAKLLASAGSSYNSRHLRYVSILSEMSATQAQILHEIACNHGGVIGVDVDADALFYNMNEPRVAGRLRDVEAKDADGILEEILPVIALPGVSIVIVQIETDDGVMHDWSDDPVFSDEKSLDFEVLRSLGLIGRVATDFIVIDSGVITVTLYHMSEMGFDFWRACSDFDAEA